MTFIEQKFEIPVLEGISAKTVEEHLKLYSGYVKHANLILEKIAELSQLDAEKNNYAISEMRRRFAFEFDGMRNHELYFTQFEGAKSTPEGAPTLVAEITKSFGSFDAWLSTFKSIAMTRGVGWALLLRDRNTGALLNTWADEQHLGHLTGTPVLLALDMWEHSYMLDYAPSEKKKYIEAFFANLNWAVLEKRFRDTVSQI